MNILFIHQNFPAQFKFLAPALVKRGHRVSVLTLSNVVKDGWGGVQVLPYRVSRGSTPNIHPWISDFETKLIRAEACFRQALELQQQNFMPDVIIAHHGWGESLFLKEVWPAARLGLYCEFFYHAHGADVGFDPEFPTQDPGEPCRIAMKNLNNRLHFDVADAGISPTHWQASTFPAPFRERITVVHDGIDTVAIKPDSTASLTLDNVLKLTGRDEIITFVNRNLEPLRGYHVFLRALPEILSRRPSAHVLIVGGDSISYGKPRDDGRNWKDVIYAEVWPRLSVSERERVHFLGQVQYSNFVTMLQLSTVHVYLTYPFVLSWSLLEAMSAGCAIVASNTKPVLEAISHDETGRLVDFFDVKGLADTVCTLLEDPVARARLGRNARAFAQRHYDLQSVCLPRQLDWVEKLG